MGNGNRLLHEITDPESYEDRRMIVKKSATEGTNVCTRCSVIFVACRRNVTILHWSVLTEKYRDFMLLIFSIGVSSEKTRMIQNRISKATSDQVRDRLRECLS